MSDQTSSENTGTATKPVYNPTTLMWIGLIGIPTLLAFLIMTK